MRVSIGDVLFPLFAWLLPFVLFVAVIWIAFSIGSMGRRLERIERQLAALGEEKGRL
ncbi:DUF4083 domain-containing protein [Geobacillus jurassicus]|uniref:Uncharacterized protein n=1 Tax=Geobacillus jurassicus TaxID=235932 RepID=A0ABV6GQD7_9BACL|nr:DUF4083 domain-containing protein [Geobacillus jurassicus]